MPLKHGTSKKAFEQNIKVLRKEGRPLKQALAISYSIKRERKKQRKGD